MSDNKERGFFYTMKSAIARPWRSAESAVFRRETDANRSILDDCDSLVLSMTRVSTLGEPVASLVVCLSPIRTDNGDGRALDAQIKGFVTSANGLGLVFLLHL